MKNKFKLGDKVSYISGVGGAETVFEIRQILTSKDNVEYGHSTPEYWVDESDLTLYIEPKKKVKKYLWAYRYNHSKITHISVQFYCDDDDFKILTNHTKMDFFKRLDWSETEFDCE